jgi:hypothetical protein
MFIPDPPCTECICDPICLNKSLGRIIRECYMFRDWINDNNICCDPSFNIHFKKYEIEKYPAIFKINKKLWRII